MGCQQSVPVVEESRSAPQEEKGLLGDENASKSDYKDDYAIVKQIGDSTASRIYLVIKKKDEAQDHIEVFTEETVYILQIIDMKLVAPERRRAMRKEIQSLKELNHPNSKEFNCIHIVVLIFPQFLIFATFI